MTPDTPWPNRKSRTAMEAITYRITLDPIPLDEDPTGGVRIGRPTRSPSLPPLPDETWTEGYNCELVEFTDSPRLPPPDDEPGPTPPG